MTGAKDIEAAVALAEASTGGRRGNSKIRVCVKRKRDRYIRWTESENEFLISNLGLLTDDEIAKALGRTACAVHLHRERELHLVAPMKSKKDLTAEHVAMGLGVDGKTIHLLMDRCVMPSRKLPAKRPIRMVSRVLFLKWICNPMHWHYFDIQRVGAMRSRGNRVFTDVYDFAFWEDARKLVLARHGKWEDEWLTPGQVAKLLALPSHKYVNIAIRRGHLKAVRWGNWRILKSSLPKGKTIRFNGEWITKKNNHKS